MPETQATPRPWRVEAQGNCLSGVGIDGDDASVVLVCCQNCLGDDLRLSPSNAALIVTAVNEHDALRAVEAAARKQIVWLYNDAPVKIALDALDALRGKADA